MNPIEDITGPPDAHGQTSAEGLLDLCSEIRREVRRAMQGAFRDGQGARMSAAESMGAGDTTFGIDVVAEAVALAWLERPANWPVSVLTEDAGWQHRSAEPSAPGGPTDRPSGADPFDHGGPRIAIDPIDGTRHLMHDVRAAWVVVSIAGPGAGQPNLSDVETGMLVEIPDSRGNVARELVARRGDGHAVQRLVSLDEAGEENAGPFAPLRADDRRVLDGHYFPFFSFEPAGRESAQALARRVFERLAELEGIDPASILDDQYISSGGQLALLAQGTYRTIVDARIALASATRRPVQTAKPYDVAGAILIAREAGCVVQRPDGAPLDFPIDATTPVEFVGFANHSTADALAPVIAAAIRTMVAPD